MFEVFFEFSVFREFLRLVLVFVDLRYWKLVIGDFVVDFSFRIGVLVLNIIKIWVCFKYVVWEVCFLEFVKRVVVVKVSFNDYDIIMGYSGMVVDIICCIGISCVIYFVCFIEERYGDWFWRLKELKLIVCNLEISEYLFR